MKRCSKCKIEKEETEFFKASAEKTGLMYSCKDCQRKVVRTWYAKNIQRTRDTDKVWREKNKDRKRLQVKRWNDAHPERRKEHLKKGAEKTRSTPKGRVNDAFSSAVYRSLKGLKNGAHWEDLVGYTIDQLKDHIEKQFKPGMSWENYGKFTWHIDHIIPIAAFEFDSPFCPAFKECWSLENLQPLEAKKNHSKGARYVG